MNVNELTNELRRSIWERQSGMCALTGKKFEEFNDSIEAKFILIDAALGTENIDNIVMIWRMHSGLPSGKLRRYLFPYAAFSNWDITAKAAEIKAEIDVVVANAESAIDLKDMQSQIKELTNNLQNIGLPGSIRNEYREMLLSGLRVVTQRQRDEFEKDKEVWKTNFVQAKAQLDAAVEFAKTATIFKEAREKLVAVQNEIRQSKLSREDKNSMEKTLNDAFKELNDKQQAWSENYEMECIENYHLLRALIDESIQKAHSVEAFPEARDILIASQDQLKDKLLRRGQKDELFGAIRNAFDELREKFTEYTRITDEEATTNYNEVKPKVDEAAEFAKNAIYEQFIDARNKLIDTQKLIKDTRLKREQKDELFGQIREIFNKINQETAEERKKFEEDAIQNYDRILSDIEVIIVDIENALDFKVSSDALAAIFNELQLTKLRKNQRNKLYEKARFAFSLLSKKRDEVHKHRLVEKRKRLEDTANGMQQKNDRMNILLNKDKEFLEKERQQLVEIPVEKEKQRESIQQTINAIEKRIKEKEVTIKSTIRRIDDIRKEIERTTKEEENAKKRRIERDERYANRSAKKSEDIESTDNGDEQTSSIDADNNTTEVDN